jgi:hypothetical protein
MSQLIVHRTTYKRRNSYLLIEKNILQIDTLPYNLRVSSLCIPPLLSYKYTVKVIFIINPCLLNISVLSIGAGTLTNYKTFRPFVIKITYCGCKEELRYIGPIPGKCSI